MGAALPLLRMLNWVIIQHNVGSTMYAYVVVIHGSPFIFFLWEKFPREQYIRLSTLPKGIGNGAKNLLTQGTG